MNMKKKKASLAVFGVILALALSACTAKQTVNKQENHKADSAQAAENAAAAPLVREMKLGEDRSNPALGVIQKTQEQQKTKTVLKGSASYRWYNSREELAEAAAEIVYGTVVGQSCEWRSLRIDIKEEEDPRKDLVTVWEVMVTESYKNDALTGCVIQVLTLGGETEDVICTYEGTPELRVGEQYIFFLYRCQKWEDTFFPLNNNQATHKVEVGMWDPQEGYMINFEWLRALKK